MTRTPHVISDWVELGEGFAGYEARPADRAVMGSVVVLPELFGLNADIRSVAERLAGLGYAAVVPDIHWRHQPRAALPYGDEGRTRGFELIDKVVREEVLSDIDVARQAAARHAPGHGSAVFGVSFGGHLAVLAATRPGFAVAVSVYGGWTVHGGIPVATPQPPMREASLIADNGTFVLGFYGDQDHAIPVSEVKEIEGLLTAATVRHEVVLVPGVKHGFLCEARPADYDEKAADQTWAKVNSVLREHLTVV